jgi:hypothetical protein
MKNKQFHRADLDGVPKEIQERKENSFLPRFPSAVKKHFEK